RKKHFNVQAGKLYEISGDKLIKKNKSCPRCKNTMAKAPGREFCGSCGYTVTEKKEEKNTNTENKDSNKEQPEKKEENNQSGQ
ncbi:MAG: hypothetical protein U9P44_02810, partial [archaeon]|nr:hypothetical protein [archaeon]